MNPPPLPFYKQQNFWVGFFGCWVLNGIYTGIVLALPALGVWQWLGADGSVFCGFVGLLWNVGVIVALTYDQRWMALGALAALALPFALMLIAALCIGTLCFSRL